MKKIALALAALFIVAQVVFIGAAFAQTIAPPTGYINDRAGMLDAATVERLETYLSDFDKTDSTQISVLTVPTLDGQSLEEFSLAVATSWGLGQKGKDNGALLVIARDERRIRIEVGYGLEGRLTDLTAGRIISRTMAPAFSQGDFDLGVTRGVEAMVAAVKGEYQAGGGSNAGQTGDYGPMMIFLLFGLLMVGRIFSGHKPLAALAGGGLAGGLSWMVFGVGALLLLLTVAGAVGGFLSASFAPLLTNPRTGSFPIRRGGFGGFGGFGGGFGGGGFGGGGFGGFGGGGFGGGGASGGW